MSYLALTYGPEKMVEWLRRPEDSKAFYASQFHHVFGKRLDDVWDEWLASERKFQEHNLAEIAKYPLTEPKHLSPRGLGSMSRGFVDEKTNSLIAAFRWPGKIGFLGRMDLATGKISHLTDLDGMMLYKVTSVAFDPATRTAFYTNQNYAYRDINAINVDTGKKRRLLTDARIGDLVFDHADNSLWGIRHQNGFVTLVRIPPPYTSFNQVKTFHYGEIVFDLDVSPDGQLISGVLWRRRRQAVGEGVEGFRPRARQCRRPGRDVVAAAVGAGECSPSRLTERRLLGNSYYTGVSNIYPARYRQQQMGCAQQCRHRLLPAAARARTDRC